MALVGAANSEIAGQHGAVLDAQAPMVPQRPQAPLASRGGLVKMFVCQSWRSLVGAPGFGDVGAMAQKRWQSALETRAR